jgi:hypothetical protein
MARMTSESLVSYGPLAGKHRYASSTSLRVTKLSGPMVRPSAESELQGCLPLSRSLTELVLPTLARRQMGGNSRHPSLEAGPSCPRIPACPPFLQINRSKNHPKKSNKGRSKAQVRKIIRP